MPEMFDGRLAKAGTWRLGVLRKQAPAIRFSARTAVAHMLAHTIGDTWEFAIIEHNSESGDVTFMVNSEFVFDGWIPQGLLVTEHTYWMRFECPDCLERSESREIFNLADIGLAIEEYGEFLNRHSKYCMGVKRDDDA